MPMKPKLLLIAPALLALLMFSPASKAPAAVAAPDRELLVAAAELIVIGELQQREDADGGHRGVIVVRETLAGKVAAGDELAVAWARKPANLAPGLEHVADYVFSPRLEGAWIFILGPRVDDESPFHLDHGRQVGRDELEEVKALVAKGTDQDFIGKTEAEAARLAEDRGLVIRVMARDGEALFGTTDYRTDRVNLTIKDGVVVGTSRG